MANMKKKQFLYKGKNYTLDELYAMFPNIKPSVLAGRLHKGMSVAEAVRPQTYEELIPEPYRNKNLIVCFDSTPPVFPNMQPVLKARYVARPHVEGKRGKFFYTVNVRGNNLIVYPGEFRILGIAKKCEEPKSASVYGIKTENSLHQNSMCLGA